MLVVYLMDHDGHKSDKEYDVELSLGRRLCENNICMPSVDYNKKKAMERAANAEAKRMAAIKKKALVKKKAQPKTKMAVSLKAAMREKQLKK